MNLQAGGFVCGRHESLGLIFLFFKISDTFQIAKKVKESIMDVKE